MSSSSLSRGQRVLRVDSLSAVLADGYWHEYGFFRCRILRCDRSRTLNGLGTLSSPIVGNRLRSAVILAMVVVRSDWQCAVWSTDRVHCCAGTRLWYRRASGVGYVRSHIAAWHQSGSQIGCVHSKLASNQAIHYSIRNSTRSWDDETNGYSSVKQRQADVYLFCVLTYRDQLEADPLNLDRWDFYCLSTSALNSAVGSQKTIRLSRLLPLKPRKVSFTQLHYAIHQVAAVSR